MLTLELTSKSFHYPFLRLSIEIENRISNSLQRRQFLAQIREILQNFASKAISHSTAKNK